MSEKGKCTFYYNSKRKEDLEAKEAIDKYKPKLEEEFGPVTCWDGDKVGWGDPLSPGPELVIYPKVYTFKGCRRILSFLQETFGPPG